MEYNVNMKSDNIKKGIARTPHRGLLMATGVSKKSMERPFIGIASSFSDLVPGHIGMRDLERQIEKGIHSAGGQSFIFGVPAICDGIARDTAEGDIRCHLVIYLAIVLKVSPQHTSLTA